METGHGTTFADFQKELDVIRELTKQAGANHPEGWQPIYDGPLSPKDYYNAPLKVMWLLKEPYDNEEKKGGWSFEEYFDSLYEWGVCGGSRPTWRPITYITNAIFNSIEKWNDIEDVHEGMMTDMAKIAFVNLNKHPAKGRARSPYPNVLEGYRNFKQVLFRQIEVMNPSIIICGNTYSFIHDDLNAEYKGMVGSTGYRLWGNRIIIDSYHPAATYGEEKYVDEILEAIRISRQLLQS